MSGRLISSVFAAWLLVGLPALAAETNLSAPKSAAVMDFELIDDMRDYETEDAKAAQERRLALVSNALRHEFDQRGMYRTADNNAAAKLITDQKALQNLRNCNGCELDIGRALGTDVVILGWVQKVSNLILNVNIEVKDVTSGKTLYTKSVDLRGNTDKSWLRGIHYMVDSVAEKKQQFR